MALFSGVLTVSYDGRSVTYRSVSDMRATIAELERQLGIILRRSCVAVVRASRGW